MAKKRGMRLLASCRRQQGAGPSVVHSPPRVVEGGPVAPQLLSVGAGASVLRTHWGNKNV